MDAAIATDLDSVEGCLTGAVKYPELYAVGKRVCLEQFCESFAVTLYKSAGYSDHDSDLPFLEGVGMPYAVNPTKRLRAEALRRGWPIIDLGKPST